MIYLSGYGSGLIHFFDEVPIHAYVEMEGSIEVNSRCEGSDPINLNRLTATGKEEDGLMQLVDDVLDLARVRAALSGDELANRIYFGTVVKLDARRIGFDRIDALDHGSPQGVYFEAPAILESSLEVRCEKG
jgi:hypothetical protein